jgi:hypothetical protein
LKVVVTGRNHKVPPPPSSICYFQLPILNYQLLRAGAKDNPPPAINWKLDAFLRVAQCHWLKVVVTGCNHKGAPPKSPSKQFSLIQSNSTYFKAKRLPGTL